MLDIMVMGHVRGIFMAIEKMGKSHGKNLKCYVIDKEKFQIFHFIGGGGGRIINTVSAAGLTVSITTQ